MIKEINKTNNRCSSSIDQKWEKEEYKEKEEKEKNTKYKYIYILI